MFNRCLYAANYTLFSTASAGFNIYTIVETFKWLKDFVQLSGHGSNNWDWTAVILVFAFLGLFGNGGMIAYSYEVGAPTPAWDAVRKYRWAEVLREAGHADHAYHVDIFYKLGKTVVIFWSVIGFICLVVVLLISLSAYLGSREMKKIMDGVLEQASQPKEPHRQLQADLDAEKGDGLQADPDIERRDDQKVGGPLTSAPLTHHPTSTEEKYPRW
ncbi:hypothetical protein F5883DRAFT_723288 [Diaporthe sp. PMI_573]|nr:hypothetical protein F5883DRAFT_723288 [Diaporthaceae sp. PMI_573]